MYVILDNDKDVKFNRGSVEAAPDSLPEVSFTKKHFEVDYSDEEEPQFSAALTRSSFESPSFPKFYRGNIEGGSEKHGQIRQVRYEIILDLIEFQWR